MDSRKKAHAFASFEAVLLFVLAATAVRAQIAAAQLATLGAHPAESTVILGSRVRLQPFLKPEELARQVAEGQAANEDPARFMRLEQSVTPVRFKGTDCVRSYPRAEDRDPDFTGHATPVLESLEFGELPAGARSP